MILFTPSFVVSKEKRENLFIISIWWNHFWTLILNLVSNLCCYSPFSRRCQHKNKYFFFLDLSKPALCCVFAVKWENFLLLFSSYLLLKRLCDRMTGQEVYIRIKKEERRKIINWIDGFTRFNFIILPWKWLIWRERSTFEVFPFSLIFLSFVY